MELNGLDQKLMQLRSRLQNDFAYKELQNARQEALQKNKAGKKKMMEEAVSKLDGRSHREERSQGARPAG
ncbi:hypothetical protein Droror1_Dr00027529 [Drosera rotundifolia]